MLMRFAPIGAFGAMAFTIGKYGVGALVNLGALIATFYLTSILFVVVVLGAVARYNGFSIFRLIAYLKDELLLVLGTSSSEAALPRLLQKMEGAGCAKSIVGLVVPTGYSFNLDGTNIYMTLAALFIAQATGVDLSWGDRSRCCWCAMITSKGAAGVTGAGFITLAATLVDRAVRTGRGHGADPRHRPLHERVPRADQLHRQRGGDDRGRALGKRARPRRVASRARRSPAPLAAAGRNRQRLIDDEKYRGVKQ